MSELKPCPFCGGAAHFFKITDLDDRNFGGDGICCGSCPVTTDLMFSLMEDCKPKLAEAWNRREQPAQVVPLTHVLVPVDEPTDEMIDAACAAVDGMYRVDFVRAYVAAFAHLKAGYRDESYWCGWNAAIKSQQAEAVPSSDLNPDEGDPVTLWAEIWRLREAVKGPDGYATWQDAATAERIRRVRAESKQAEVTKTVATHDDTDLIEQMLEALRSCSGVPHWPALIPTINAARKRLETPQQAEAVPSDLPAFKVPREASDRYWGKENLREAFNDGAEYGARVRDRQWFAAIAQQKGNQ